MKQCPICHSTAFDDAITCFGCLHEFASGDDAASVTASDAALDSALETKPVVFEAPPAFLIQIRPERERSGHLSWTCTVDLVPA